MRIRSHLVESNKRTVKILDAEAGGHHREDKKGAGAQKFRDQLLRGQEEAHWQIIQGHVLEVKKEVCANNSGAISGEFMRGACANNSTGEQRGFRISKQLRYESVKGYSQFQSFLYITYSKGVGYEEGINILYLPELFHWRTLIELYCVAP